MTADLLPEYLEQMLEAARLACGYVQGMDSPGFRSDRRTQQAVVLNLMVIGEVANRLHSENPNFLTQHAAIPWKSMRGMRNRIAHGYFDIDLDIVWDTVERDLPALIAQLEAIRGTPAGEA